jgi:hypothetical protein
VYVCTPPRAAVLREKRVRLSAVYIRYVKGVAEKFKCIANRYNINMIFSTKHTKTRQERDQQQTAQCVCSIPCECGRSYLYTGETGRPLAMQLRIIGLSRACSVLIPELALAVGTYLVSFILHSYLYKNKKTNSML